MLTEIYCDAFSQKKIKLNKGLNVVLGTNIGDNSIGKSTFMLIVDFIFGGKTYPLMDDIIKNVGEHKICFTFLFDSNYYYFSRSFPSARVIEKCDKNYKPLESIDINEYLSWLKNKYNISIPDLSFRDVVGRYIRAYSKDNCLEKKPLNAVPQEKSSEAVIALLKLFDRYAVISTLSEQYNESKKNYYTYKKAQSLNFIAKINQRQYNNNTKDIEILNKKLEELSNNLEQGLIELNLESSKKAIYLKKSISKAKRYRSKLVSRMNSLNDNGNYVFSITSDTYIELMKYFPNVNLEQLSNVESFHNKISSIFKTELKQEIKKIHKEIIEYDGIIASLKKQLDDLIDTPKLSTAFLQQYSDILKYRDKIEKENNAFIKSRDLKASMSDNKKILNQAKAKQCSIVENIVNLEMERLNDAIYGGITKSPILSFSDEGYTFFTPDDTGTGIAYKGLIVYDIAVLNLTCLPILVHDSVLLKQISDNAIERIMEQYIASNKQVIIALDKQDSYTNVTTKILEECSILHLEPNGGELFGKSWGNKITI